MPLTLNSLQWLVQNPKEGHKTQYYYYNDSVKNSIGYRSTPSHWVLMTRDVIPGSRNKSYQQQRNILTHYTKESSQPYKFPTAIEAATCILMEYVQTGTKLYGNIPWTYTLCQEGVAVGGFGGLVARGLDIITPTPHWDNDDICGVSGSRKLSTLAFGTWTGPWSLQHLDD